MPRPTSYAKIAKHSLETLPQRVKTRRARSKLSVREAAREIGIGRTTLARIEAGRDAATGVLVKVFAWLDGP